MGGLFAAVAAIAMLALLAAAPVSGQDGNLWYTNAHGGWENKNDSPVLHPESHESETGSFWGTVNPPGAHGADHHGAYHYTYGNKDSTRTNWATWAFRDVSRASGTQYDVWVWVPRGNATAQVRYNVHLSGCVAQLGSFPILDQNQHGGWVKIGRLSLGHISNPPSSTVTIEVNDNEVADPNVLAADRSIGVDAVLLVTGGGIGWDAVNSNHLVTDANCFGGSTVAGGPSAVRDLKTSPYDSDTFRITWSPPSNDGGSPISTYEIRYSRPAVGGSPAWSKAWTTPRTSRRFRPAHKGVIYTVEVTAINQDGERGPTETTTGTVGNPEAGGPSAVRDLKTSPYDSDTFRITWSPPSNDGGSPISTYEIRYSRPAVGGSPAWSKAWTTPRTSRRFRPAHKGVIYTVEVTAINQDGERGPTETTTGTVGNPGSTPPETLIGPTRDDYIRAIQYGSTCNMDVSTRTSLEGPVASWPRWTKDHRDGETYAMVIGECTSWVQFRLRANGVQFSNGYNAKGDPSCCWSDAHNWESAAENRLNEPPGKTPRVGSVAYWEANAPGAGDLGHVAYVEWVSADLTTIVVSEMNGRANYVNRVRQGWCTHEERTIQSTDSNWPTKFIYF